MPDPGGLFSLLVAIEFQKWNKADIQTLVDAATTVRFRFGQERGVRTWAGELPGLLATLAKQDTLMEAFKGAPGRV